MVDLISRSVNRYTKLHVSYALTLLSLRNIAMFGHANASTKFCELRHIQTRESTSEKLISIWIDANHFLNTNFVGVNTLA
ncbi:MAG: hypothetical protein C0422_12875 [Alcaligenaceae bacterium]|nr:hypothetical protein [Alcaligenaceae bacterium]